MYFHINVLQSFCLNTCRYLCIHVHTYKHIHTRPKLSPQQQIRSTHTYTSHHVHDNFLAHDPCGACADAVGRRAGLLCLRPRGAGALDTTTASSGVGGAAFVRVSVVSKMIEVAVFSASSGRGGKPLKSRR